MINALVIILVMYLLFKATGFMFGIMGKVFGGILGLIGYAILGVLAVSVFGLALFAIPIILVIGLIIVASIAAKH